jgi:ubiquinone/menaquinone biosynthesis C-methylase UbiE
MKSAANFDRLARVYRWLEYVAFGRDLERARTCYLDRLSACRSILVLGEGDGRCLAQLVRLAPEARIECIDASRAMLDRAAARLDPAARARVTFTCADAFTLSFDPHRYEAVLTLFFLDCFNDDDVALLVQRIAPALRPGGFWLFADFVEPARGFARWRARVWLAVLYAFFRWQTGLHTRVLPASEAILRRAGLVEIATRTFQDGLVRAAAFTQPSSRA